MAAPPFPIYNMTGLIFVGVLYSFPVSFLLIYPALLGMNPEFEDAAKITGAGFFHTTLITFRIISPAIIVAFLLSLIRGVEVMTTALFIGLPAGIHVIATDVFEVVSRQTPPQHGLGAALAVILFFTVAILIVFYRRATSMVSKYVTVTGKTARIQPYKLRKWKYPVLMSITAFYGFFIIFPTALVVFESLMPFGTAYSTKMFNLVTLQNFQYIFSNIRLTHIISNTVLLALLAAIVCSALSILLGYVTIRTKMPGRGLLHIFSTVPLATPGVVLGLALIWLYVGTPIYATLSILVMAVTIKQLPFAMAMTTQNMYQIAPEMEESSRICGSSFSDMLRRIMMPLISPAYFAGLNYIVIRAVGELELVLLLRGTQNEVLTTFLWEEWIDGSFQVASTVAVIMLVLTTSMYTISRLIGRRVAPPGMKL